jgi:CBS domain-containing protein
MQVREAMAETISVAAPNDTLMKVAQLMREEDAGFTPVCDSDRLLGVVTDRDIVIRCIADGHNVLNEPAEHCMTSAPVVVEGNAPLEEAARLMAQNEVRRLPVTGGGRLIGILSHGNLVQALGSEGTADQATLGVTRGA